MEHAAASNQRQNRSQFQLSTQLGFYVSNSYGVLKWLAAPSTATAPTPASAVVSPTAPSEGSPQASISPSDSPEHKKQKLESGGDERGASQTELALQAEALAAKVNALNAQRQQQERQVEVLRELVSTETEELNRVHGELEKAREEHQRTEERQNRALAGQQR